MVKIFNKTFYIIILCGAAVLTAILFLIYPKFFISQLTDKNPRIVYFPNQPAGGLKVDVEVAANPYQWSKGLMFRDSLPEDSGMLFIFPNEEIKSFWMKNTFIPLDIIFISKNKEIVDIKENFEPCPDSKIICPTYTSKEPAMFVLEVNSGYCAKHNIKIGDAVEF
ncbi:DUF192 domain-containing protein [Candidatus Wolfebacteria bacterium]|nr:DUF192 domain-containing protein [Candidatus Wolfebacteria bacterium]